MKHKSEENKKQVVRPYFTKSDSASRKRPFSTGLFFHWILLVLLLVVSRVDLVAFVIFLEVVGVREYRHLCASGFLREERLDEPSSQRVGGFGLRRKPVKLLSWSCTKPRGDKGTSGCCRCWQHGIDTARVCHRVIHAAGERNKKCATLTCCEKQQTAVIAKPASALE